MRSSENDKAETFFRAPVLLMSVASLTGEAAKTENEK